MEGKEEGGREGGRRQEMEGGRGRRWRVWKREGIFTIITS